MRLHRFYIDKKIDSKIFDVTDRDLVFQWKKVFRYNVGSQVIVFDGSGIDFLCIITSLRNLGATLEIIKSKEIQKPNKSIWLCMSMIKKDKFEFVAEKATELWANCIIPIQTERSEKKNLNTKRIEKIIKEASEQSGRGDLTKLLEIKKIEEILESGTLPQEKIFLDPTMPPIDQYLKSNTNQKSIAIFIGPEGGFGESDINIFKKYNVYGFSVGPQILKAETAPIVALSLFL